MRALIQRVTRAKVEVEGRAPAEIGPGVLILLGVHVEDCEEDITWLIKKIPHLRLFNDPHGQMNLSLLDTGGDVLVISQFTLYASSKKGTRPSFHLAAKPEPAQKLYEEFVAKLEHALGKSVPTGAFGQHMEVSLQNTGPVTILLDSLNRL